MKLKKIFDDACSHLKIDRDLAKKIRNYRIAFISKPNTENQIFFGGNLTGCYVVRYTSTDRDNWFRNILQLDEDLVTDDCHRVIDPETYKTAADVMNISCVWLAHRFAILPDGNMSQKDRKDVIADIFFIMQCRFLTSLMYHYWIYPCSQPAAKATFESLSNKFSLRRLGSWMAVLDERAKAMATMDKSNPHYKTLMTMGVDLSKTGPTVAYYINDSQGRIRDMIKNIYAKFDEVHRNKITVGDRSAVIDLDGELTLRDKTNDVTTYRSYIVSILPSKNDFIKPQLLDIVTSSLKTVDPESLDTTLEYISSHYPNKDIFTVDIPEVGRKDAVEALIEHVISHRSESKKLMSNKNDLIGLLAEVKGIYTASKASNPVILALRERFEDISYRATKIRTPAKKSAIRTGLILYIVLRTFTMKSFAHS